jgi:hypothetical protein
MPRMGFFAAAAALAACATAPNETAASSNDCFRSAEIRGFSVIDRNHVRVSVGANRHYVLTTLWNTNNLDWTQAIAIRTATGRVCTGNGLGVELIGGEPRRTHPVTLVERAPDDPPAVQGS